MSTNEHCEHCGHTFGGHTLYAGICMVPGCGCDTYKEARND